MMSVNCVCFYNEKHYSISTLFNCLFWSELYVVYRYILNAIMCNGLIKLNMWDVCNFLFVFAFLYDFCYKCVYE